MSRDYSAAALRALAPIKLLANAPLAWDYSDDDMNAKARMIPEGLNPKPAAVLVPIILRPQGLTVLLTQRAEKLSNHAGQIAFPGGRLDAGETAENAALREAFEETGLDRDFISPLGFLKGYLTVTGYMVTPLVALVQEGFQLVPQKDEVSDIFEVPLDFLMNADNRQTHALDWNGLRRHYYVYPYQNRNIWGATAGMIKSMEDMLFN